MRKAMAVVTLTLFAANAAAAGPATWSGRADSTAKERRSTRLWAGLGLLAGGVGLASVGALRWGGGHHMDGRHGMGPGGMPMMDANDMTGGGMMGGGGMMPGAPMNGMMGPMDDMDMGHREGRTVNALTIGLGALAASAGAMLILKRDRAGSDRRSVRVRAGIGRIELACSF